MAALPLGAILNGASGVLLLAVGVFIATVRPRRASNVAFGAFIAAFGCGFIGVNWTPEASPLRVMGEVFDAVAFGIAAIAGALALLLLPRALERTERRDLLLAGGLAILATAANVWWVIHSGETRPWRFVRDGVQACAFGAEFAFGALLALRARAREPAQETQRGALMAAALLILPLYIFGQNLASAASGVRSDMLAIAAIVLVSALYLIPGFLWLMASTSSAAPRAARNVGLGLLTVLFAGMVGFALSGNAVASTNGILRTVGLTLLGYAVLRHQALDIDLKLRWTIKRGTIAAAFIGVFFVGSQVAQNVFSTQYGPLFGGITAGVLLFAISPLQRAAERFAERAVPTGPATAPRRESRELEAYRHAVRAALADGRMTPDEELHLARVAESLGIGAATALEVRRGVEAELPQHP